MSTKSFFIIFNIFLSSSFLHAYPTSWDLPHKPAGGSTLPPSPPSSITNPQRPSSGSQPTPNLPRN